MTSGVKTPLVNKYTKNLEIQKQITNFAVLTDDGDPSALVSVEHQMNIFQRYRRLSILRRYVSPKRSGTSSVSSAVWQSLFMCHIITN